MAAAAMNAILQELNVQKEAIPTKRNCDWVIDITEQKIVFWGKRGRLECEAGTSSEILKSAAAAKEEEEWREGEEDERWYRGRREGWWSRFEGQGEAIYPILRRRIRRGGGGCGTGKKGSDGPKKKYPQKEPKRPIPILRLSRRALGQHCYPLPRMHRCDCPLLGSQSARCPHHQPQFHELRKPRQCLPWWRPSKQPAATQSLHHQLTYNLNLNFENGNDACTDVNDTWALVTNPAKITGK